MRCLLKLNRSNIDTIQWNREVVFRLILSGPATILLRETMPLIIAYHLIWTAYGWWLPNDPRGSTSKSIRRDTLKELGELHFGRKRVQPASWKVRDFYESAANSLLNPLLTFTNVEITAIAEAFAAIVRECRYTYYACAIMPDHVHVLVRKHKHLAEEMIVNLQRASHFRLLELKLRDENQRTWSSGGGWKCFSIIPMKLAGRSTMLRKIRSRLDWHGNIGISSQRPMMDGRFTPATIRTRRGPEASETGDPPARLSRKRQERNVIQRYPTSPRNRESQYRVRDFARGDSACARCVAVDLSLARPSPLSARAGAANR